VERLIRGYREFRKKRWPSERARYETLAVKGQRPEYLIIACSDSRSDPATIFNARPGEFFLIRNVAALVPPYEETNGYFGTRAAIAYAVLSLNVRNIVVMGHAQCGGVAAALNEDVARGVPFLSEWLNLLKPAVIRAGAGDHAHKDNAELEREAVALSVERLLKYPFVAERVGDGRLAVDGLRFGIADGKMEVLNKASRAFEPLDLRPRFMRWFSRAA
jgi:carbonic anhydrase